MQTAETCPAIARCFCTTLHTRGVGTFSRYAGTLCCSAASAQSQIGFFNTLLGCLSPLWEAIQAEYWAGKQSNKSPHHWAWDFCAQLLHLTHSTWLARNHRVQDQQLQSQWVTIKATIHQEFELGLQHLLPADFFHVQRSSPAEGFSLESVLSLPLGDQQLWIHSIQLARSHGSHLMALELARMQASFHSWLHPPTEISYDT